MVKIAVLMSTYNGEKYIKEQLESIISQNLDADMYLHIFIRDDCSNDSTKEIALSYSDHVTWIDGKNNIGPARSFFELMLNVSGYDYYFFSDQDDFWDLNKVKKMVAAFGHNDNPKIIFSNALLVNKKGKSLNKYCFSKAPNTNFYTLSSCGGIPGCTMCFNNSLQTIFQKRGNYISCIKMHDNYLLSLCSAVGGEITMINEPLTYYRQHDNNTIGVAVDHRTKNKQVVKLLKKFSGVHVSQQVKDIYDNFSEMICPQFFQWIVLLSKTNDSFLCRLRIAFSPKIHLFPLRHSIFVRTLILFNKR